MLDTFAHGTFSLTHRRILRMSLFDAFDAFAATTTTTTSANDLTSHTHTHKRSRKNICFINRQYEILLKHGLERARSDSDINEKRNHQPNTSKQRRHRPLDVSHRSRALCYLRALARLTVFLCVCVCKKLAQYRDAARGRTISGGWLVAGLCWVDGRSVCSTISMTLLRARSLGCVCECACDRFVAVLLTTTTTLLCDRCVRPALVSQIYVRHAVTFQCVRDVAIVASFTYARS